MGMPNLLCSYHDRVKIIAFAHKHKTPNKILGLSPKEKPNIILCWNPRNEFCQGCTSIWLEFITIIRQTIDYVVILSNSSPISLAFLPWLRFGSLTTISTSCTLCNPAQPQIFNWFFLFHGYVIRAIPPTFQHPLQHNQNPQSFPQLPIHSPWGDNGAQGIPQRLPG